MKMKNLRTPSLPSGPTSVPTPSRALCMQKGICYLLYGSGCSLGSTLRTHGLQTARLLSMGFPRQEYWSGLPFPPRGDLPEPGIEPVCTLWANSLNMMGAKQMDMNEANPYLLFMPRVRGTRTRVNKRDIPVLK